MKNHIRTNIKNGLETNLSIVINPKLEVVEFDTETGSETKEDCQKIIDYLFKGEDPLMEYNTMDEKVVISIDNFNEPEFYDVYLHIGDDIDEDQTPIINQEDIDKIFK